jgi:hypothetical protein
VLNTETAEFRADRRRWVLISLGLAGATGFMAALVFGVIEDDFLPSGEFLLRVAGLPVTVAVAFYTFRSLQILFTRRPILSVMRDGAEYRWEVIRWKPRLVSRSGVSGVRTDGRFTTLLSNRRDVRIPHWLFKDGAEIPAAFERLWGIEVADESVPTSE